MVVILSFMVVLAGFAGWWLLRQGIASKPWLEVGIPADAGWTAPLPRPTARLGLAAFLVVAGSLFALLVSAYVMRMGMTDWRPLPMPVVLWFSTGLLALSSVALHTTVIAARRGELDGIRSGLLAAGVSALAFLAGQLLAWRELAEAGYFAASNPAGAFFGLVTAIHGLHMLGGLVALWRITARACAIPMGSAPQAVGALRLGVELCATYWHFLLLVWLVLFSLLMRWADELIEICRGLVT
ncbi:cytochrome C oxidase [Bosea sp. Root381]|uniref:cytochrome c oxidase subunit 3 n=1 Tax=Bosea sp. Root381 TaxID=1736524 RepID=UPI0006FDA596|nr:cytochrome c oxidase subunit 3 [Bosea sp. Root381]KRE09513.1 cytochrome C oxidase [Bosea sp. Root381]